CVTRVGRFSVAGCRCKTAGQVPDERLLSKRHEGGRARRLHRASHMMIQALGEALEQEPQFKPELTVIGTTSGGMSYGEDYYRSLDRHGSLRHAPTWIANYPAQKPVIDALEAFEISAPCQVVANACASGTNAIGHAFECVRSGRYRRILAGGYDAVSEMVFVGFDSLQASTPEKCRPFDRHRTGMVLGEGAAILALENLELAQERDGAFTGSSWCGRSDLLFAGASAPISPIQHQFYRFRRRSRSEHRGERNTTDCSTHRAFEFLWLRRD